MLLFLFTVPFNVSEISQPNIIYAQVPTDLKCTIQGATRWELKVKWFKQRTSPDSVIQPESGSSDSLLETEDVSERACLQSDGKNHTSLLPVFLTVTEDQTKYQCVVWCKDRSFRRETTVKVKGEQFWLWEQIIRHSENSAQWGNPQPGFIRKHVHVHTNCYIFCECEHGFVIKLF